VRTLKLFRRPVVLITLLLIGVLFTGEITPQSRTIIDAGKFSAEKAGDALPMGWKPLTFKKIEKHTTYSLITDGETVVVKAVSNGSASGLTREMRINPEEVPILRWRWKVANLLQKSDVTRKDGDDYPARLYITFEVDPKRLGFFEIVKYEAARLLYGQVPPLAAINYLWDSRAPKGTIVPNPFTDRVKMIVVESGTERLNQWVSEERNIVEDYQKAFGENPSFISGIAIMTDTDNTGESATACYGDILFTSSP
jgi:hypothetical protein